MPESIRELGHRNASAMHRSLSDLTQKRAAELMSISETTLSNWKNEHMERLCMLAAVCGLKLESVTLRTLSDEHLSALKTLARMALEQDESMLRRARDL